MIAMRDIHLTCDDVNECSGDNAYSDNASCYNTKGCYECNCNKGSAGSDRECSDINECDNGFNACDQSASCENNVGSYTCNCLAGYIGFVSSA